MKKLTLQEKIKFCELYIESKELGKDNCFICNRFEDYYMVRKIIKYKSDCLSETACSIIFPELYKMIMEVGRKLWITDGGCTFEFGDCWLVDINPVQFRKRKIQELLVILK